MICANRSYAILNIELTRVGAGNAGPKALSMLDIGHPDLDWVALARGMGVEAERARGLRRVRARLRSRDETQRPAADRSGFLSAAIFFPKKSNAKSFFLVLLGLARYLAIIATLY